MFKFLRGNKVVSSPPNLKVDRKFFWESITLAPGCWRPWRMMLVTQTSSPTSVCWSPCPLFARVPIIAADFGPRTPPAWPFRDYVDIKSVDLNSLWARSCKVLNRWRRKQWASSCADIRLQGLFLSNLGSNVGSLLKSAWNLGNYRKTPNYWRVLSSSV